MPDEWSIEGGVRANIDIDVRHRPEIPYFPRFGSVFTSMTQNTSVGTTLACTVPASSGVGTFDVSLWRRADPDKTNLVPGNGGRFTYTNYSEQNL